MTKRRRPRTGRTVEQRLAAANAEQRRLILAMGGPMAQQQRREDAKREEEERRAAEGRRLEWICQHHPECLGRLLRRYGAP